MTLLSDSYCVLTTLTTSLTSEACDSVNVQEDEVWEFLP